jgi:hypothetical protein
MISSSKQCGFAGFLCVWLFLFIFIFQLGFARLSAFFLAVFCCWLQELAKMD